MNGTRIGTRCRRTSRPPRRRARACAIRCWKGSTCSIPTPCSRSPRDGETLGEVMFRGNVVMRGYLKNKPATDKAFAGGWFHSGDLGVMHPDGYIQLKDRSKDIIISGGENISSIEVEDALYKHPAVQAPPWWRSPTTNGAKRPALRGIEARPHGNPRGPGRLVPRAPRRLQMPAPRGIHRTAEDLDGEDRRNSGCARWRRRRDVVLKTVTVGSIRLSADAARQSFSEHCTPEGSG